MKKQFLITGLFFSIYLIFPTCLYAQDKTQEFSIQCKILDSVILSVEDGRSKRFSSYIDGYEKGDSMNIAFKHTSYEYEISPDSFNLHIYDRRYQKTSVLNAMVDADDFKVFLPDNFFYESTSSVIVLSKNIMQIDGIGSGLMLKRFYRDDWEGVYTRSRERNTHVMTLSCLGATSKYSTLLNKLQNFHD